MRVIWSVFPSAMLRSLYIETVLRSKPLATIFPFRQPVVLLLSYPRSGSSWIGKMLSTSPDVAYLREPINQAFLKVGGVETILDPARNETTLKAYSHFSDQSFAGIPPKHIPMVVGSINRFSPFGRSRRTLLIKEVNPIGVEFFVNRYFPKIVLLLRHPAAVADSFKRMGWLDNEEWEQFGFRYGKTMENALKACAKVDSITVVYEDVALYPKKEFLRLFEYINVMSPSDFERVLAEYSESSLTNWHPYTIRRTSRDEIEKWRRNLEKEQINAVMKGYMRSDLQYYRERKDWADK